MDEFDKLVEQADQEMIQNGFVSPFTQMQLQAHVNGKSVPHIDVGAIFRRVRAEQLARQDAECNWYDFDCDERSEGDAGNW